MPTFDHLRWHLVLALGGALVIEWLHGPFATGLVALIVVDRVATAAVPYLRRRRDPAEPAERAPVATAAVAWRDADRRRPRGAAPADRAGAGARRRLRACRGFGCRMCAYTGLS